ncbi:DNA polymerase family A-domain-containing protein [Boletus edulis BED1]|uniref:Mitochondrial DNA polymerase catalytic subunit n=1 Tax=Boletus edulis BED1 TaxID=1328754 RepID=A0AAD4G9B3_BOLED|nr:DNA polymerase family A-domain-containing protein [Boletus edulis BED1]
MLNPLRRSSPRVARKLHISSPPLNEQQKNGKKYEHEQSKEPKAQTSARTRKTDRNADTVQVPHVKRNELGVQMLSRQLHAQIFKHATFPPPEPAFVQIARDHLHMHGLDPKQGSVLPDTGFTLPPLQGADIDQHFYHIGQRCAQPWLSLAKQLAQDVLPPKPEYFDIQSGWTKYYYLPDGSGYSEHVAYPEHGGQPEQMLVFDVETMPPYHPYAVLACAASKHAWYFWISPWLLGETEEVQHLIPFGNPETPRVVVGHNVSYDRQRVHEEYSLRSTQTRFMDTMSLHVAVNGISSHQRPAWMKHRKAKANRIEQRAEAVEAALEIMRDAESQADSEVDAARRTQLRRLRAEIEESLPQLQEDDADATDAELSQQRWEDLTSANGLADVAKLYCNIDLDKGIRGDFMTSSREAILAGIQDYLGYCAGDVHVTHQVFAQVLPAFLERCPSPVSFAGILTMGTSFLTVNESWEEYLRNAERTYQELEGKVKKHLVDLAEEAKDMMQNASWRDDPWLSQLDWTPKVAKKSRGVYDSDRPQSPSQAKAAVNKQPAWLRDLLKDGVFSASSVNRVLPILLKLSFDDYPLRYTTEERWHFIHDGQAMRIPSAGARKILTILGPTHGVPYLKGCRLTASDMSLALAVASGERTPELEARIIDLAKSLANLEDYDQDPWLRQLDWRPVFVTPHTKSSQTPTLKISKPQVIWPKWYWDLARPKKDLPPGTLDITVRNRNSPILLRLSWMGHPLFYSREHGWTFRVPSAAEFATRAQVLGFSDPTDQTLCEMTHGDGKQRFLFYKLPHKDGESANVGSPLSKTFMKYAHDGTLTSPGDDAQDALDMNAQCSYWISARDRILNQMVVWQNERVDMQFAPSSDHKWGMIIPQVITMGTVTRRAIEKTWLTASNAKKNRVGSELKAMVRAPPGYAIIGADVDSEELWISSCMGDAQFGLHGATAIGWMTLEGTKAAGTDLHSKTANILGISRDQAKVFNYSRIYGAGMKHAVLLLLQSNAAMQPEEAKKLAENLYASTKGKNTHRPDLFGRKFWYGGTESYVFNKLEEIALSDRPQTPALGCGITAALSKENLPAEFGVDYMTSRINWVVQSSGVDYLHLLLVAMDHLTRTYDINARFLLSVHDELRYLVSEADKYRAALALQIANLWTRSLFAFKLGMDDLPQCVAFFSAVDVDRVLRKEVDMTCETPSHPWAIPPGESLDIMKTLERTSGSLWRDQRPMDEGADEGGLWGEEVQGYQPPDCLVHRAKSAAFLRAQATDEFAEVRHLAKQVRGQRTTRSGEVGGTGKERRWGRVQGHADVEARDVWMAMQEVMAGEGP